MVKSLNRLNPVLIFQIFLITVFIFSNETAHAQSDNVTVYPNPASGIAPLEVELTCVVATNTTEPASYILNFGDGSEEERINTNDYSAVFTHTYNDGFFKPTCTVIKSGIGQKIESKPAKIIVAKWKFETNGDIDSSPAIGPDGNIYVGSDDRHMYAVSPDTGEEIWRFATGDVIRSSPAIGQDGSIYFGSLDNHLYALSPRGALRWSLSIGAPIFSSPAISTDGSSIYFGASDNNIYKISRSGVISHTYKTSGKIVSSPAIGHDGFENVIYVGSTDKHLYALAADNLNLKWKFEANAEIYAAPAISSAGQIYVGECRTGEADEYAFKFYSINPDGTKLWEFDGGTGFYSSPAIGPDGNIYVGSWDGNFYALNYKNGKALWGQSTSPLADVNSSPAIGSNGVIYVGCKNGAFYGLQHIEDDKSLGQNEEDKSEDWVFMTGGPILDSSPAIDSNGTIYFGSRDNNLYAINPGNMQLAESAWPMFHKAPDHNGSQTEISIPDIISKFPISDSLYVSIDTAQIIVNFSPDIDASQIQIDSFKLEKLITNKEKEAIEGESFIEPTRYNNTTFISSAIFEIDNPDEQIEYGTSYLASISYSENPSDDNNSVRSESNELETVSWQFTTEPPLEEEFSGSGGESCFVNLIYTSFFSKR